MECGIEHSRGGSFGNFGMRIKEKRPQNIESLLVAIY